MSTALRGEAAPERIETRIVAHDDEGRGLATMNGIPLRVEGALEGERVTIEILRRRRRYIDARLVDVLEPSARRVRPSCEYFHQCGGCRLQHLRLDEQRAAKQRLLERALSACGVPAPRMWYPPIAGSALGYRRKARLGVKFVPGKGGALVGFREKRGSFIADVQRCEVLVPSVGERILALRELISGLSVRNRIPQIEVAAGDDDTALVLRHLDPLTAADCDALRGFARRHRVRVYLQPGGMESISPLWPEDPPPLRYRIPEFDLEFEFEPAQFVQVNAEVNRALVSRAVDWLAPGPGERLLDLYCGIGNFSLAFARRGAMVHGVEASEAMVTAARGNANSNEIANARFEAANLDDPAEVERVLAGGFSSVFLDPPRSGAARVAERLEPPCPARIVYVSCNPESFARDAAVITGRQGYRLELAGIVDMFPHTRHVEMIGQFVSARQ